MLTLTLQFVTSPCCAFQADAHGTPFLRGGPLPANRCERRATLRRVTGVPACVVPASSSVPGIGPPKVAGTAPHPEPPACEALGVPVAILYETSPPSLPVSPPFQSELATPTKARALLCHFLSSSKMAGRCCHHLQSLEQSHRSCLRSRTWAQRGSGEWEPYQSHRPQEGGPGASPAP